MNVRLAFAMMLAAAPFSLLAQDEGLKIGALSAQAGSRSITLSLSGGAAKGEYRIYRSTLPAFTPGADRLIATVKSLPYTDSKGLKKGVVYYYKVLAGDAFAFPKGTDTNPTENLKNPIATPASLTNGTINVVAIGDSITQGVIIGGENAPPVALAADLAARSGADVYFTNKGVSGRTTLDWRPGTPLYQSALDGAKELTNAHPDGQLVFSVMLGTNDSAARTFLSDAPGMLDRTPKEEVRANLKAMIDGLLAAYPKAKFFLHHPIWYSPNTRNGANYQEAGLGRLGEFGPEIDALAKEYRKSVYVGDTKAYAFFAKNYEAEFVAERAATGFGTFYLHPNVRGAVDLGRFQSDAIYRRLFRD